MEQSFLASSFCADFLVGWDNHLAANRRYHFLRVCAIFDHYGYRVPKLEDWEDLTWYSLPLVLSHVELLQEEGTHYGSDTEDAIRGAPIAETSRPSTGAVGSLPQISADPEVMTVALYSEVLWPTPFQGHGNPTNPPPSTSRSVGQLRRRPLRFEMPEPRGVSGIPAVEPRTSRGHGRPKSASSSTRNPASPRVGAQSARDSPSTQQSADGSAPSGSDQHSELVKLLAQYDDDSE